MMEDPGPWFVEGFHLPSDVVHQIVTLLPERDLCALKICSRYWHSVCSSDLLWFQLFRKRWKSADPLTAISPFLNLHGKERPQLRLCDCSIARPCATHNLYRKPHEGWQVAYRNWHLEMGSRAKAVVELVKGRTRHESVEVADYQRGLMLLSTTGLELHDVLLYLLNPGQSVLINLIGLHYCLLHLGIQGEEVKEKLARSKVGERQVCLRWWSIGGWANGFRRQDEMHVRKVLMSTLTEPDSTPLFHVLDRGTLHEVLRVQISADFESSAWVQRDMHSQR